MIAKYEISPELDKRVNDLKGRILNDPIGILDPPGQHHQFASLVNHGRKLDLDKIKTSSDFFWQLTDTYAAWVNEVYAEQKPEFLLGVANGANRMALTMAGYVRSIGLETYKKDSRTVALTDVARLAISQTRPKSLLIIEDVGTTGGTTSTVVPELRELGVQDIEVSHVWIRNRELKALEEIGIPYRAIIHEPLPTFSEEDCRNLSEGFCNQGVLLIPHSQ